MKRFLLPMLFLISWLAQVLRRKINTRLVCSTFVQRVWESCGFIFDQTPDPGDYMRHCHGIHRLARDI